MVQLNSETGPDSDRPGRQNTALQSSKPQPLREAPGKEARRIRDVVHVCLVYVHHPKSGTALAAKNSSLCQTQLRALRGQAQLRSASLRSGIRAPHLQHRLELPGPRAQIQEAGSRACRRGTPWSGHYPTPLPAQGPRRRAGSTRRQVSQRFRAVALKPTSFGIDDTNHYSVTGSRGSVI